MTRSIATPPSFEGPVVRASVETALRRVPFFSHLTDAETTQLVRRGHTETVDAGHVIFRQGDPADKMYVVLCGTARVYKRDSDGREVTLALLGEGHFFGEMALLDTSVRSASVVMEARSVLFALDRQDFLRLLGDSPQFVAQLMATLTARVRETSERFFEEELAARTLETRMEVERLRALSQLVAGVAHELNTPLGIIRTASSYLSRELTPAAISAITPTEAVRDLLDGIGEAVSLIDRNVARAHKLVEDFKKTSVDQITDTKESFDLPGAVEQILDLFRLSAGRANLEMQVVNDLPAEHSECFGYRGYLTQVILNLLTNVERYAYPAGGGGRIEIRMTEDRERAVPVFLLDVRDFGVGIPGEHLPKVFNPFFTTGRAKGGTGLGLAIVHNLVTGPMGGTAELTSEPGRGTTVRLVVPQRLDGLRKPTTHAAAPS